MRINIIVKSNFAITAKREILMITAVRPYNVQNKQQQNFKQQIPQKPLEALKKGNVGPINRFRNLFLTVYTKADNQPIIRQIYTDPATVRTETLEDVAEIFDAKG